MWALVVVLGLVLVPAAGAANQQPRLTPIEATFDPTAFATTYTASASDPDGDKLSFRWSLTPPAVDPKCNKFSQLSVTKAIWHHGDQDRCNHAAQGPRGHRGTVNFTASDGTWTCTETYDGTISGGGPANTACTQQASAKAVPKAASKATYRCSGAQTKLFDSSNVYGVVNGAKQPSFSTGGKAYCLASITTYHWNNGQGKKPGTIGLTGTTTVGPLPATGSSGQGGAPNVNWTVNFSSAKPVVVNGSYSCNDSDPATWSQNQQSHGTGFCIVYGTPATKTGPAAGPQQKTTKISKGKTGGKGTTAKPKGGKGKLSISASPDTGNPPLTVTFSLSSPRVVQWRIDYGDGRSKVAVGNPPATITHTYTRAGGYRPRLTVLASPAATSASSATTSVSVGTALISFTASPASGNPPLRVTFTLGTSVTNITTWSVDFGDGQRAGGGGKPPATVSHTYATAGSFRATFALKPGQYALVASFAQITVGGGTPPVLSLSATPTSGRHPLSVTFALGTNIPGQVVSWQLQFGDGQRTGGSGRPPATISHTYAKAGTYGAYLVVAQQQQYGGVQYVVPRGGLPISVG